MKRPRLTWKRKRTKDTATATLRRWEAREGAFAVVKVISHYRLPDRWLAIKLLAAGEYPIGHHRTPAAARRTCEKEHRGLSARGRLSDAAGAIALGHDPEPGETTMVKKSSKTKAPKAGKTKAPKVAREPKPAATPKPAKERKPKAKAKADPASNGKLSALDAAAQVLGSATVPMNAKQLIETMASQSLWSSPGGKTPHATLAAAIVTEIIKKGKESRFKRTSPGHFALAK